MMTQKFSLFSVFAMSTAPLTLLNVNARSLVNKADQFEAVLFALKPDIGHCN